MSHLETNIAHLPLAYRCAIESLGASGERNTQRLERLCDHFEAVNGLQGSPESRHYRDSAAGICARRYWNFDKSGD
jgi:hypothetical protein